MFDVGDDVMVRRQDGAGVESATVVMIDDENGVLVEGHDTLKRRWEVARNVTAMPTPTETVKAGGGDRGRIRIAHKKTASRGWEYETTVEFEFALPHHQGNVEVVLRGMLEETERLGREECRRRERADLA